MNSRELTIGRALGNDLVISNDKVSNFHARLLRQGTSIVIEDLNSTNHIYIEGNLVTQRKINVGETIQLSAYYTLDWNHPVLRQWLSMSEIADVQVSVPVPYSPPRRPATERISSESAQWKGPDDSYCSKCGSVIRNGLRFCGGCGASAGGTSSQILVNQAQPIAPARGPSSEDIRLNHMQAQMDARHHQQMKAMSTMQSVTGKAWFVFFMYYIGFYITGLILNLVWLSKCSTIKNSTGHNPPGHGCLVTLLVIHFLLPVLVIIIALIAGVDIVGEFDFL